MDAIPKSRIFLRATRIAKLLRLRQELVAREPSATAQAKFKGLYLGHCSPEELSQMQSSKGAVNLKPLSLSSRQSSKDFSVLCNAWSSAQRSGNESKWQFERTRNKQVLKSLFPSLHLASWGLDRCEAYNTFSVWPSATKNAPFPQLLMFLGFRGIHSQGVPSLFPSLLFFMRFPAADSDLRL